MRKHGGQGPFDKDTIDMFNEFNNSSTNLAISWNISGTT